MLKIILFPLALLYMAAMALRNWLYNKGFFESQKFNTYTINVGNLAVGGTGKTPLVEYLINLLSATYDTSVISRGYGRKTDGFVLADEHSTAKSIGDEPMQYYLKFKKIINVAVSESRVEGFLALKTLHENTQIVLLDDAYQHRSISPHLNLLLTDYNQPFYADFVLPAGRLRESRYGAKRADAVIITKCPAEIPTAEREFIEFKIKKYTSDNTPTFFAKIKYSNIVGYNNQVFMKQLQLYLISAIAVPIAFEQYLRTNYEVLENFEYADHYDFVRNDIDRIFKKVENIPFTAFVTTEKDMVKLKPLLSEFEQKRFYYLPIEVEFENKKDFNEFILSNCSRDV